MLIDCRSSGNYIVVDRLSIEWQLYCCWSSDNYIVVDRLENMLFLIEWQLYCCWSIGKYVVFDRVAIILLLTDCRSSGNYIVVDRVAIICRSSSHHIVVDRVAIILLVIEWQLYYFRSSLNPNVFYVIVFTTEEIVLECCYGWYLTIKLPYRVVGPCRQINLPYRVVGPSLQGPTTLYGRLT